MPSSPGRSNVARVFGQRFLNLESLGQIGALILLAILMSVLAPSKFLRPVNLMNIARRFRSPGLSRSHKRSS